MSAIFSMNYYDVDVIWEITSKGWPSMHSSFVTVVEESDKAREADALTQILLPNMAN